MAYNKNSKPLKAKKLSGAGRSGKPERQGTGKTDRKDERRFTKGSAKGFSRSIGTDKPFENKPKSRYYGDSFGREEENDENINLIEGRNPVLEALKSGREIDKLFIQKGITQGSIRQIIAIAKEKNILIKEVDKAKLDGLSTTKNHQGVIASAALYKYYDVDEILQIARNKGEDPFIVILDEITDNNNLGSILRTADAAGVHGVIIPKRRSVGLTPVVGKISAGAIEYVPVAKVTNLNQTIEKLKSEGLWIIGAEMSGETYYKKDLTGPIALIIGSEGEGLGRLVKENCDFLVSIPMKGNISSLNAAVSAAIIMYEVCKQRSEKDS